MKSFTNQTGKILILISLVFFFAVSLWLRLLPMDAIVTEDFVNLLGNDPWYKLRQIEVTVQHFPGYAWFDPMTEFPTGNVIHWGPLFSHICSIVVILFGASARPEMMYIASWIPPIMGALLVPVVFLVGRSIADDLTGFIGAGLVAVVSGQFFYRSLFGFVDHHVGETLFSTIFCLAYIAALISMKSHRVDLRNLKDHKMPVFLSAGAGIAYIIGLAVMPTMVLFALIVAVFTAVQFIFDFYRNRSSDYLLLLNTVVFGLAIIGLFIIGIPQAALTNLVYYSTGHIIVYLAVILFTALFWVVAKKLHTRPKFYYPLFLSLVVIIAAIATYLVVPELFNVLFRSFFSFFGEEARTLTIQEARPWSALAAWETFHYGLLLMLGGIGVLLYRNIEKEHPEQVFVLVWAAVILLSTIRHVRYEYYLSINVALLSAVFIGAILQYGWKDIAGLFRIAGEPVPAATEEKSGKKKKKKGAERTVREKKRKPYRTEHVIAVVVTVLLAFLFLFSSLSTDLAIANGVGGGINSDWQESLRWMRTNTPDTGVDYYAIYDKDTFTYPPEAYGVMSWWDYGHWITFVAQRIPNANPFQHGVSGPSGSAAFFIQQSEEDSSAILDRQGTRFVVTDIEMDVGKFWAMATWYNETVGVSPYQMQATNQQNQQVTVYTAEYFHTMISRLHNFDGSLTESDSRYITELRGTKVSVLPIFPIDQVPALRHYRLVHESPSNVFNSEEINLKYVKVFEYVPGARIRGEGVISLALQTNTGRTFVYRQESINGEFVVPYSTLNNPYGVAAKGKYTIEGTDIQFDVPEEAVTGGLLIN